MKTFKFTKNKKIEETTADPTLANSFGPSLGNELSSLDSKTKYVSFKSETKPKKRRGRKLLIILSILFVLTAILGVLAYNYVYMPYTRIKKSVDDIQANASSLLADFDNKDLSKIDTYFANIKTDLNNVNAEIDRFEFLEKLEYTKGYYDNFQVMRTVLDKTSNLLDSTLPDLKNLLKVTGFKTEKSDPNTVIVLDPETGEKKEDSAFSLVMKELPQYLALYSKIEPQVIDIFNEVKKIDPNYVPQIGGTNYSEIIKEVDDFSTKFPSISKQTMDFLSHMPEIIGSNDPATYLVILQNETEMRASGGLLSAFGTLTMSNGEIGDINLEDMWNLETHVSYDLGVDVGYRNIYGQLVLMERGCGAYYLRAQDAGIYPDLKLTMQMLADYYNVANYYSPADFPSYNYVLIINNHFAETLIDLLDPLEVEGFGTVTSDKLYDLIKSQTDSVENRGSKERKSIIKDIANAAKKKLFEFKIADLARLINAMVGSIQAKDIGIYAPNDSSLEAYLEKYGFSGETAKTFEGDYFQLSEAQNCALKINRWLRNDVTQTVNIDDNGNISKSVYTHWVQPEIYQDSYLDQYDMSGRFTYRAWVRYFMPTGSTNVVSDGYNNSGYLYYYPEEYQDAQMQKYVSDNIIQFDSRRGSAEAPIPESQLNVSYNLPDNLNYNATGSYKLLVQKHPGKSWGEKNTVIINHGGQEYKVEFILDRDKIITYRDGIISVDNYNKSLDFIINLVNEVPWDKINTD